MGGTGFLEAMARADLEAITAAVAQGYRGGSAERLAEHDPAWREALDRTEAEVGALFVALCEADATLLRWRRAVAELYRLWARLREVSLEEAPRVLEEVA
jgi:hypothetical protein